MSRNNIGMPKWYSKFLVKLSNFWMMGRNDIANFFWSYPSQKGDINARRTWLTSVCRLLPTWVAAVWPANRSDRLTTDQRSQDNHLRLSFAVPWGSRSRRRKRERRQAARSAPQTAIHPVLPAHISRTGGEQNNLPAPTNQRSCCSQLYIATTCSYPFSSKENLLISIIRN